MNQKEKIQIYRDNNREMLAAKTREWRKNNPEKAKASPKRLAEVNEWAKNNPEKRKVYIETSKLKKAKIKAEQEIYKAYYLMMHK